MDEYKDFNNRLKLLISKRRDLIINTLSNIFTMRLIGNKTHGDLAEIGMAEFINQFMYDWLCCITPSNSQNIPLSQQIHTVTA